MTKRIAMVAAAAMMMLTTACSDGPSGGQTITDQNVTNCLSYMIDNSNQAQRFGGLSFGVKFYYEEQKVDLVVTGLVLPEAGSTEGIRYPQMTFSGLKWEYNKCGWKEVNVSNVAPTIMGMSAVPMFTKLNFALGDIVTDGAYTPGVQYEFSIDGKFSVIGEGMVGTTVSTAPSGATFSPEAVSKTNVPVYMLIYDFNAMTADIKLFNARFLETMPALNLEFPKVPFKFEDGVVTFEIEALTPEYNGIPFPTFPITKLSGRMNYLTGMTLNFHCGYRGEDYKVQIDANRASIL